MPPRRSPRNAQKPTEPEEKPLEEENVKPAKRRKVAAKLLKKVVEDEKVAEESQQTAETTNAQNPDELKEKPQEEENVEPPKERRKVATKPQKKEVESDEVEVAEQTAETIYEFTANDLNGDQVSLDKYKDHVCVIVNVASRCGHTKSNYQQFNELFEKYSKDKGLQILAFPCNQFGGQEPGDSKKICDFVKTRNVQFDVFEKVNVNGKNAHPLWQFLKDKKSTDKGNDIKWNFTKFVIDKEGKVVERFTPATKPLTLVSTLEKLW